MPAAGTIIRQAPRGALFALLYSFFGVAGASDGWSLNQTLAAIAAEKSDELLFTEFRHIPILEGPPIEVSGRLRFEAPSSMIKAVEADKPERLVVDGDTLRIEKQGEPTKEIRLSAAPPVKGFVESFRATLAGDRETLERFYHVVFDGTRSNWRMELKPRGDKLGFALDLILIEGNRGVIRTFTTYEASGNYTVMKIDARQPVGLR